ncbi:MAG: carbonic anhydrase, partial [Phycisphaerae bacterium]
MLIQSKFGTIAIGALLTTCLLFAGDPPTSSGGADAGAEALRQLQIGHARFLCGKPDHPRAGSDRREDTFKGGQHPFAIFLSCADSRVPVEVIFDQGVGDVFVVRVAGNVTDKHQAGSIEYGVEHLHAPLVVVMGHRGCGAVAAAASNGHIEGNVGSIVDSIKPAVERAERANPGLKGDGLLAEAVKANVFLSVENLLKSSPMLSQLVKSKKLTIVGAVYDIE